LCKRFSPAAANFIDSIGPGITTEEYFFGPESSVLPEPSGRERRKSYIENKSIGQKRVYEAGFADSVIYLAGRLQ
jgi:hypothetical protein